MGAMPGEGASMTITCAKCGKGHDDSKPCPHCKFLDENETVPDPEVKGGVVVRLETTVDGQEKARQRPIPKARK